MAETITLESLLQLTRRVFKGDLKRADLARRRSQKEVAFVGVAIMLARHEDFLDDQGVVLEAYDRILERLMSVGVVNRFNHEAGYKTGQNLVAGSRALELHLSIPMEGSKIRRRAQLKPPDELVALVRELGCTKAVLDFLRDAEEGMTRQAKWLEEYRARALK